MSSYKISYVYRKPGSTGGTSTSYTAKATTERTALEIVKGRHPGFEIVVQSAVKVS
jgi:hypothetical protein